MDKIKTLANCTEIEFLRQTNRIRKAVQKWLDVTAILDIRKRLPALETVPGDASDEERERIAAENKARSDRQVKANLDAMLDEALEKHPEETAEIIKLCCFVDPEDKAERHISYYLAAFTEMLGDEDVLGFFTSLVNVGRKFGLTA